MGESKETAVNIAKQGREYMGLNHKEVSKNGGGGG